MAPASAPAGPIIKAAIRLHGTIYTGWRHAAIKQEIGVGTPIPDPDWNIGFITENGYFLTRKQAKLYALVRKQITHTQLPVLSSEDLWDDNGKPLPSP
jgi:hypothetical protein